MLFVPERRRREARVMGARHSASCCSRTFSIIITTIISVIIQTITFTIIIIIIVIIIITSIIIIIIIMIIASIVSFIIISTLLFQDSRELISRSPNGYRANGYRTILISALGRPIPVSCMYARSVGWLCVCVCVCVLK